MARELLVQAANPVAGFTCPVVHIGASQHAPTKANFASVGSAKGLGRGVAIENRDYWGTAIWASIHTLNTHHFYGA